ncbi:hypothetical protein GCM10010121_043520 [Streptomyces brasiliensis]|uniref:DoxX family membrane protein n=1 Tax=Streptomyces brasiliensis TaxID=1954 RepID=A0A917KS85_9ACTN|nr:hypothetical protein GCM10010121_043520 [Streptomyces brasiliensis]
MHVNRMFSRSARTSPAGSPADGTAAPPASAADWGLLLLRLTVGLLMAGHGAQKLFGAFGGNGLTATGKCSPTSVSTRERSMP